MFKNESNISDFVFLVFLTAPIWIVLLMGYEFFKNLRDIIIYCAWGGAYIYGLCIGAILGYVFLKDNVVLAVITFFSSNIIFILNFMQETSEYQNLYTLGKIFFEMNIFFLFVTLLSNILEKHDCKKNSQNPTCNYFAICLNYLFFLVLLSEKSTVNKRMLC